MAGAASVVRRMPAQDDPDAMATDDLPADRSIPILPCRSIDEQLSFYEAIGCEVTYRQKAPNVFAASCAREPGQGLTGRRLKGVRSLAAGY
jgi:hypothetical protein